MFYQNAHQVKATARAITRQLRSSGTSMSFGQVLDALSRVRGFSDWNAYSASLSQDGIDAILDDFELAHAHDAADADLRAAETGEGGYGPESVIQVHTGFFLKTPMYPDECDYVRVCDPLGREIAYWTADEWKEEPESVMGAILGAVTRGQGLTGKALHSTLNFQEEVKETGKQEPSVTDVDFFNISRVALNSQSFQLDWLEEAALDYVGGQARPDYAEWEATTAVSLIYEEDGLATEVSLTVGELNSMQWNASKRCFVSENGDAFIFYFERAFGE